MALAGSEIHNNKPVTLDEVLSLIEASNVAQGIAISAALHSISPEHVDRFARYLADLTPCVGASDDVAERLLECVQEGVDGFLKNR